MALAFQNLYEAVNNIPVHIGLSNLKHILYHALLPQFLEWTKGFPLSIEEFELRDKNWVKLVPRQPDIDVIADQFFEAKAKSKVKVFSAKKSADLSLCVKNEKYQEILQHLNDLDERSKDVRTLLLFCAYNDINKDQVLFPRNHGATTSHGGASASGTAMMSSAGARNKASCLILRSTLRFGPVQYIWLTLNGFIYKDSF